MAEKNTGNFRNPDLRKNVGHATFREIATVGELKAASLLFGDAFVMLDFPMVALSSIGLVPTLMRINYWNYKSPDDKGLLSKGHDMPLIGSVIKTADTANIYRRAKSAARKKVYSTVGTIGGTLLGGIGVYDAIKDPTQGMHNIITHAIGQVAVGSDIYSFYTHHNPGLINTAVIAGTFVASHAANIVLQGAKERYFATRYRNLTNASPKR